MRRLWIACALFLCLCLCTVSTAALTDADISERLGGIARKLERSYDDFTRVTFLEPQRKFQEPASWSNGTKGFFYPYIGFNNDEKWVFLRAQLFLKTWAFMERVVVIVDGTVYQSPKYTAINNHVTRRVRNSSVFEQIDMSWRHAGVESIMRTIADAPLGTTIKVRFSGEMNYDFVMSERQHQVWKDMIFYFDHLDVGRGV